MIHHQGPFRDLHRSLKSRWGGKTLSERLSHSNLTFLQKELRYLSLPSPSPPTESYRSPRHLHWKKTQEEIPQLSDFLRGFHSREKPLQVRAHLTRKAQKLLFNTHHDRSFIPLKHKPTIFFNLVTEITKYVICWYLQSVHKDYPLFSTKNFV